MISNKTWQSRPASTGGKEEELEPASCLATILWNIVDTRIVLHTYLQLRLRRNLKINLLPKLTTPSVEKHLLRKVKDPQLHLASITPSIGKVS